MHASTASPNESAQATYAPDLQAFVFVLFFAFGGITSLNDVLIPKLKALVTLNYGEVRRLQPAFFAAYFFISIPPAALVRRIGHTPSPAAGPLLRTTPLARSSPPSPHTPLCR